MNKKRIIMVVVLLMIASTAFGLNWLKAHQNLGQPGIKAEPIPGSVVMKFDLPERVLEYTSTNLPEDETVLAYLPKDTSFAQRAYFGTNDPATGEAFQMVGNIILQGADRSSIHNADYCLAGGGCTTQSKAEVTIAIDGPQPYELPVSKWTFSRQVLMKDGKKHEVRGVYVFWFVADGDQTPRYREHLWRLFGHVLRTGVLQRWAYVSFQSYCYPGQEEATFERMKPVIAACVPEFQLPPKPAAATPR